MVRLLTLQKNWSLHNERKNQTTGDEVERTHSPTFDQKLEKLPMTLSQTANVIDEKLLLNRFSWSLMRMLKLRLQAVRR